MCLCVCGRATLEERLRLDETSGRSNLADSAVGSKQLTFTLKKVSRGIAQVEVVSPIKMCLECTKSHCVFKSHYVMSRVKTLTPLHNVTMRVRVRVNIWQLWMSLVDRASTKR